MPKMDTPTRRIPRWVYRYGLALTLVAAALALTLVFETYRSQYPALRGIERAPAALFFCAIAISSWFGGTPGLLATLASGAMIYLFLLHPQELISEETRLVILLFSGSLISLMGGSQRRAKESLREARDELELKVQERTAELQRVNRELQAEITERKEAEQALLSSEAQLKQAQAIAHLGSYEIDVLTGTSRWSDEIFRILGLNPQNGAWARKDFVERIADPEDRQYAMERYDQLVRDGRPYNIQYRIIRPDGSIRFVQSMAEAIRNTDGALVRFSGALLDVTERKQVEDKLARLNRTLQTLYQCNQALVHATDEYELLHAACRILAEVGGLRMAWVGYREFDLEKSIRPVAQAGYDEGYVESVKATWEDTERGHGPTGTAIRTGKPSWTKNIQTDSSIAPWRAEALKHGYGSNISLPLMSDEATFGALTLYAKEPNAFNERTLEQFTELANNLAYGVIALRTREERKRAEEELQKQTAYLDELFELAPEAIVLRAVDNR